MGKDTLWYWHNGDPDLWGICEMYWPNFSCGVQNMTDDEIVASVLDDFLILYSDGVADGVPWHDFFRFIQTRRQAERVLNALCDERVQRLTVEKNGKMRLVHSPELLQEAMDIAGRWLEGFVIPEGVETFSLSEKGAALFRQLGFEGATHCIAQQIFSDQLGGNGEFSTLN